MCYFIITKNNSVRHPSANWYIGTIYFPWISLYRVIKKEWTNVIAQYFIKEDKWQLFDSQLTFTYFQIFNVFIAYNISNINTIGKFFSGVYQHIKIRELIAVVPCLRSSKLVDRVIFYTLQKPKSNM